MAQQRTAPPDLQDAGVPSEVAFPGLTTWQQAELAYLAFAGAIQDRPELANRAQEIKQLLAAADSIKVWPHGGIGFRHSSAPTPVRSTEGVTARERALEKERDELKVQVQLLRSNVAELRREVARRTRDFDQLLATHHEFVEVLKRRSKAEESLLGLLLGQKNGRLRMFESYEGVVDHVHGDSVTVVFETDDDVVEHCYNRGQFVDGQLPNVGDRITVCVHVVLGSLGTPTDPASLEELDDDPGYERKRITGALEF